MVSTEEHYNERNPWDCEVFLLGAPSLDDLLDLAGDLLARADSPALAFPDFALDEFHRLTPGSVRLGIIARDFEDLKAKIEKALEKLSGGASRIRDVGGIYYTDTPLGFDENGHASRIGFVFPGEGSQYLGMLGDLADVLPEVAEILDHYEQLKETSPEQEKGILRFFRDPALLDSAERAEAESDLKRIDYALFTAFIADWIILSILKQLKIPHDTISGHSGGELLALLAAKVIDGSEEQFDGLIQGFHDLGKYAPEDRVESKLLALATSGEKAEAIIEEAHHQAGRNLDAYVAMKNCPHQTVIVGVKEDVEIVEGVTSRKGVVYQHLELDQPYHTPLFEPYMVSLREMFRPMTFQSPETPTYSCTTGELFPEDPEEIYHLTLTHWESPVQFVDLIENQYRDGVRCFVEVGPRSNLCSFIEDILRGRNDVLVVPANVQRASGISQINHLVAQLFVNHFFVDPAFLYEVRYPSREEAEEAAPEVIAPNGWTGEKNTWTSGETARDQVMMEHFRVMEEFLETQQVVMENYYSMCPTVNGSVSLPEIPLLEEPASMTEESPRLPMIDEVIELDPGHRIEARRSMVLEEDLFSAQHTVGGRALSQVVPDHYGLPVVPMTFSIEMMAETAQALFPELRVVAMSHIKLYKALDYEGGGLSFAQVNATVTGQDETSITLEAKLFHWSDDKGPNFDRPAAIATIEMESAYPMAPAADDFQLIDQRTCDISCERLYQNLFHGEEFQGVMELGRYGDDGIEGHMVTLPRPRLFASNPDPHFLYDPVLLDVSLHPMCAWHLDQEDQSGRILLPIGVDRISFYGPRPEPGTRFDSRATISRETSRQYTHEVDIVDENERVWCRMQGCHYWRFYLPFRQFNFHGPKNVYMLSEEWDIFDRKPTSLPVPESNDRIRFLDIPDDLRNPTMQPIGAKVTLSETELAEFQSLDLDDDERTTWLFERVTGKEAIRSLWHEEKGERLFTADVEISTGESGHLVTGLRKRETPADMPGISLAHSGTRMIAMASDRRHVGIEVEDINAAGELDSDTHFSPEEQAFLSRLENDRDDWATRFLAAKRAIRKCLAPNRFAGAMDIEMIQVEMESGTVVARLADSWLEAFPEFTGRGILVRTTREENLAIASTGCESIDLNSTSNATYHAELKSNC